MLSDNHCSECGLLLTRASQRHPVDHTWDLATAFDDCAFSCRSDSFEDVGDGQSREFPVDANLNLPFLL